MRFAVMFGFLAFAALDLVPAKSAGRVLAATFALLFVVRMAVVAELWRQHRDDLASLRAVIAEVPPGAKVFFTNVPREEAPDYWDAGPRARRLSNGLRADYHLPALLLIERKAFWPVLFAARRSNRSNCVPNTRGSRGRHTTFPRTPIWSWPRIARFPRCATSISFCCWKQAPAAASPASCHAAWT